MHRWVRKSCSTGFSIDICADKVARQGKAGHAAQGGSRACGFWLNGGACPTEIGSRQPLPAIAAP